MLDNKPLQKHQVKEECLMVDMIVARQEMGKFFTSVGSVKYLVAYRKTDCWKSYLARQ